MNCSCIDLHGKCWYDTGIKTMSERGGGGGQACLCSLCQDADSEIKIGY